MKRKPKFTAPYTGPIHPVGLRVRLVRPHLWAGHSGSVKAVNETTGVHRIALTEPNKSVFHTEAQGGLMEAI